jgi:xanthine dehydrogenase accessory factor
MTINPIFNHVLILIKGAGDLASGVAYRLKRAGFPLMMTELPTPLMVRRAVCFGEAVYTGKTTVEGITARRVDTPAQARDLTATGIIPVLVAPQPDAAQQLHPAVLVDAIMAKRNTGTTLADAPLVIALGPGFSAGQDCHAVIETNRGHWLGRVIYAGSAQADTKTPGPVKGHQTDRVLRAPASGHVLPAAALGQIIEPGQLIATINGVPVVAPFGGVLRGLIHPSVPVTPGLKIGDLDPRGVVEHCFTISDKSLAVGGGVLEAVLAGPGVRNL